MASANIEGHCKEITTLLFGLQVYFSADSGEPLLPSPASLLKHLAKAVNKSRSQAPDGCRAIQPLWRPHDFENNDSSLQEQIKFIEDHLYNIPSGSSSSTRHQSETFWEMEMSQKLDSMHERKFVRTC